MRVVVLFLMTAVLVLAEGFPEIFSSAGDDVYTSMHRYQKIKDLDIYADRPEFLESFCGDANSSIQKGYALDKMQKDPEATIDKAMIKSYAKELRRLATQNEGIEHQLQEDIRKLYKEKDFISLLAFQSAEIELNQEITEAIKAYEKKKKQDEALAVVIAKSKNTEMKAAKASVPVEQKITVPSKAPHSTPLSGVTTDVTTGQKVEPVNAEVKTLDEPKQTAKEQAVNMPKTRVIDTSKVVAMTELPSNSTKAASPPVEEKKVLTKLEFYEQNIIRLKEELYALRDSGEQEKMSCLNDITAINYWMIDLLKNERDACAARDAIKQMKSYDKSSVDSCGRDSIRYMEWHGRIKPYVGKKLFQAEAACNR